MSDDDSFLDQVRRHGNDMKRIADMIAPPMTPNSAGVTAVDIERLRMWPDALKGQRMIGLPDTLRDDLRSVADEIERLRALPPPEAAGARREEIARALSIALLGDDVEWKAHLSLADRFTAALPAPSAPPPHSQDRWTRDAYPPEGGDSRKLVTLEKDGMIWVGIRAYDGARWLNNGKVDPTEKVIAWQELDRPAYSDGLMGSMTGPTLPAGDGQW